MHRIFLILLISASAALAQGRFLLKISTPDHGELINFVNNPGLNGITVIRDLDYPFANLNGIVLEVANPQAFNDLRQELFIAFPNNFLLLEDPLCQPTEGSGDDLAAPFLLSPFGSNPALDNLVPARPITAPVMGHLSGSIVVDIIGTGVDYSHADLSGMPFLTGLSVMSPEIGAPTYPADVDFHNHETRLAGCIGGTTTGLLTALGTTSGASYRSVLCYDPPASLTPAVPTTYATDCIAAIAEVIAAHEGRLAEAYLKNHGAVLCFSHSVLVPNTRVGDLDAMFDLAWERGIVTSISGGNANSTAAANSPAGSGEFMVFPDGGGTITERYWPPFGYPGATFDLPGSVGFDGDMPESVFHLKSGAHTNDPIPLLWTSTPSIGTNINTSNPGGLGPTKNNGIDLFAPGADIRVPATRLTPPTGGDPDIIVDGTPYDLSQGYQKGNGTSYSAAYTAALATRILQLRPWAGPDQIRQGVIDSLTTSGGLDVLTVPELTTLDPMPLTYDEWIVRYADIAPFGYFDTGMDALTADPDDDGIANFVEYYCGMDPRHPDPEHAPKVQYDPGTTSLTITMQEACYLPDPAEVGWTFQKSSDLENWDDVGRGTVTTLGEGDGDGVNIEGSYAFAIGDELKEFYRAVIFVTP